MGLTTYCADTTRKFLRRFVFGGLFSVCSSRLLGAAAELNLPRPLLKRFVDFYIARFGVDMNDVIVPDGGFRTFGEFFVRSLNRDARPVCDDEHAAVSPCDVVIMGKGRIESDGSSFLVKGCRYRLDDLVLDAVAAKEFRGGEYCIFYLHPRDYHRVHSPVDGIFKGNEICSRCKISRGAVGLFFSTPASLEKTNALFSTFAY